MHMALDPISALPATFAAMLMVMALYEEEKRRIERNMLALSNLNLAASSFAGGEIHRMLSQALDRVLGVVRLPAGALFLNHGDPQGPTSVVAVGLKDEFCRIAQEEGLDDYLVTLVSRLGGLMGFRDLRDDSLMALGKGRSDPAVPQAGAGSGFAQHCRHQLAGKDRRLAFCCWVRRMRGDSLPLNCGCCWLWGTRSEWPSKTAADSTDLAPFRRTARAE
jgi:hypothetical protein